MRPGAWSTVGFLGPDERLEDVLTADARALAELGLTPVELAEPLELLIDAYELFLIDRSPFDLPPMYEEEVARYEASRAEIERRFGPIDSARFQVGERYEINFGQSCGTQICPWSLNDLSGTAWCGAGSGGSGEWRIRNLVTGDEMRGPDLIVHLIRAHGFFEGRESPYRVDAVRLARLLELGPFAPPPV